MSSVVPPSAPPMPQSSGGGAVVVTAVADVKALQDLPLGSMIEAVAQARANKGVLEVMTASGPLQLKVLPPATLPPIPEGARLLLQVGGTATGPALNLLSINGRPLAGVTFPGMTGSGVLGGPILGGAILGGPILGNPGLGAASPGAGGAAAHPGGQTGIGHAAAPTTQAIPGPPGIVATIIRPAQLPGQAPSAGMAGTSALPANLPPGTQLTVRIAGIEPALPTTPPNPVGPSAVGANAAQQMAAHKLGNPVPTAPLPTGTAAPPLPISAPAATAPTTLLNGTVASHPPGGQAVLTTPIGTIALPTAGAVPVGSVIRLEVVAPPSTPTTPPTLPNTRPEGLTPQGWPALTEAMDTLAANDRQALDLMMRTIPAAGPRLAAAMVAFTGAMRSNDTKAIIGDGPSKALDKAGRRDLVDRLKSDLSSLAEDAGRPVGGGEWRLHTMPFSHGAHIDPIRLFVRGAGTDEQKRKAGGTGNDRRFILDFNLSNLGRLQLDGLVRREDKLFDLIIRTGAPLPQAVRMDIMSIFTQASDMVGTKGTVAFQSGGRWIDIRTDDTGPTRIEA
ncbi:DNA polymerase III [Magnetospirillum sulfuroxidans]|uniref:DNA polymerase III n=1 Tax=Magnetospirillum sulfuroxidans TaxID=611300 RepID=A0ABS5IGS3_9PROT|nr:DNA polymerase III [Magnetospirillum sulfuroxidans]MBR9973610.1 DNA polymerase III [Magnetospirillum sulfuroxidans]